MGRGETLTYLLFFQLQMIGEVVDALTDQRPTTAEDCVKWARMLFQVTLLSHS